MDSQKTSRLAITSLIAGILGLFVSYIGLLPIAAIILGVISIKKIKKDPNLKGRGLAIAGLILGIIALVLLLVTLSLGFGLGGGLMAARVSTVSTPMG